MNRYILKRGKFGMFFYDKEDDRDEPLGSILDILNHHEKLIIQDKAREVQLSKKDVEIEKLHKAETFKLNLITKHVEEIDELNAEAERLNEKVELLEKRIKRAKAYTESEIMMRPYDRDRVDNLLDGNILVNGWWKKEELSESYDDKDRIAEKVDKE